MMNTNNYSSISVSQTMDVPKQSQPSLTAALPTFPLPGAGVPSFNYAIAVEQYQFQQSLVNKQVLAHQQAVAYVASIQTAVERAAEISKLLQEETKDLPTEKSEKSSLKREKSKSLSTSPAPQLKPLSSRSKSVSPVRCRNGHREHDKQSPTAHRSYRTDRYSSYYSRYGDRWGYSRSSYRRDGHFDGRSYHGSGTGTDIGRSRRRSPFRSRFLSYPNDDSHPSQHHRSRSPLPKFKHKHSARVTRRPSLSKSPQHTKNRIPRKSISTSLLPPEYRKSRTSTSLLKDNSVADVNCRAENNGAVDLDVKHREKEAMPFEEKLLVHESSNSSRLGCTSSDPGPINHKEPGVNQFVSGRLRSARRDCSSSLHSNGPSTQRALRYRCDKSNSAKLVPPRSTKGLDHSMQMLDNHQTMKDRDISNRHTDHLKSPSDNRHHSPDGSLPTRRNKNCNETKDNMDDPNYIANASQKSSKQTETSLWSNRPQHERKQKVIGSNQHSASFSDVETDERMLKNDCLDVITMEDGVKNNINYIKGEISDNDDQGIYGHPNLHSNCAIYPLPEANESADGKEIGCDPPWPEEVVRIDAVKVPASPIGCQYETYRHGSLSVEKKKKHSVKHHKKRHRKDSESEIDRKKAKHNKRKRERTESKSHRRLHKRESKSRKRRHRDMSSSSSSDD
ncbi:hypothetical protein AQUCO_05300055v1 [Aquilegia coerulea]|uniref:Uncharacterized protein n=1 Tax=Aquilegia coerulea TaxID=218851 RepID=A0A2G5CI30_AQUCA|nr:hypothetical protein AQUCO_05300055v1 [Aquilegia coerulea]